MANKCENCRIDTNYHTNEEFEFDARNPEHHKFIDDNILKNFLKLKNQGEIKPGNYENYGKQKRKYCADCAKAIKRLEIKRISGIPLEPELEEIIKTIDYHENGNYYSLDKIEKLLTEQNKKLDFLDDLVKKIDHLESKFTELQTQLNTIQINQ